MFQSEKPIQKVEEDKLGRKNFSKVLANSILDWKGDDSLVLALNGKWGSGKSSIINLAKAELNNSPIKDKPIVIEFNPWFFSGDEGLNEHFFNEISKELNIMQHHEIADTLKLLGDALTLPTQDTASNLKNVLIVFGTVGITIQQFINNSTWSLVIFCCSLTFLLVSLLGGSLKWLANIFSIQSKDDRKTISKYKETLQKQLRQKNKKLLIIMDDVDRLTPEEIRILFKLIKINSDFSNVMYLLSFDYDIVKSALEVQAGVNGHDYLEKIVQVSFDIPLVRRDKIHHIFIEECNEVLKGLPDASQSLITEYYWNAVFNGGLKNLFKNMRDIKRFVNSFRFNISFLHRGNTIEVNPVDFVAIEAIRVFAPNFHHFMKGRKHLFTAPNGTNDSIEDNRVQEMQTEINKLPDDIREHVQGIVVQLFPQLSKIMRKQFMDRYSPQEAVKALRVCSPIFFDAYFTLIPGGDESELSQYETDIFIETFKDIKLISQSLLDHLKENKIKLLLERIENYTDDTQRIREEYVQNIINALFNVSDFFPDNKNEFFGLKTNAGRVILQLLERNEDLEKRFHILMKAITSSQSLIGPIDIVNVITNRRNKLVHEDKIVILQKACLSKIREAINDETLFANVYFLYIFFRWKEWFKESAVTFFKETISTDLKLLQALTHFISIMNVTNYQGTTSYEYFDFAALDTLVSSDDIKPRMEVIRMKDGALYKDNKKLVDMFIDKFRIDPRD